MTQDEIIKMTRDAGFDVVDGELRLRVADDKVLLRSNCVGTVADGLKAFADIVAARVVEDCAKVCDDIAKEYYECFIKYDDVIDAGKRNAASECAAVIRASLD